jgi:hypothetical protein
MRLLQVKRVILALLACAVAAGADEIVYSAYWVKDQAKNSVATTAFSLAKTLLSRTMIMLNVELDQTKVPPLADAVTGASRPARHSNSEFRKNRGQIVAGLGQQFGENTRIAGNFYFSQEPDYRSQAFGGSLAQDFALKNFTVELRGQYTMDSVGEILADGSIRNEFKETHQASLLLTQLLSPASVLRGGADAMRLHGFLSDPYSKSPVSGSNDTVIERHPSLRFRYAVWSELTQYLRPIDGAFIVNYRYYWDDWGMTSHTADFQFNKRIAENWIFTPEYRYYTETEANFEGYGGTRAFDNLDRKLWAFGSSSAIATLTCYLRGFSRNHPTWDFLNNSSVSAMYMHYFDDSPLINNPSDILQASLTFTF